MRAESLPRTERSDSGRVGWAIAAFARAKSKGFSCVLRWQPRQVFSDTAASPAFIAAGRSRITGSDTNSLPAPWHASQPTPSVGLNVFAAPAGDPPPVAWHFRHAGEVWGSSTPAFFASSAPRGVDSTA
jgi:hypothetical protein